MAAKPAGSKKKPYHSPRLVVYGDLRRLTAVAIKGGNKADGVGKPATKK